MARGTTVFRIRMRLIFRRCWNPITPWAISTAPQGISGRLSCATSDQPRTPEPAGQTRTSGLRRVVVRGFGPASSNVKNRRAMKC